MPGGETSARRALTWTGWQAYDTHGPKLSKQIQRAARNLVDVPAVKRDLQSMMPNGAEGQPVNAVRMIVRSVVGARANRGVLGRPLVATYKAGWKEGTAAAKHAIAASTVTKDDAPGGVKVPAVAAAVPRFWDPTGAAIPGPGGATLTTIVDWSGWTPGSALQADAGATLEQLIRNAVGDDTGWQTTATARGSLLASIEDGRIDKLVDAVTQALADGTSVDDLSSILEGVLDDSTWADMVATTELARAMTAASMASYRDAGIPGVAWLAADDDLECVACMENEQVSEIAIGADWPQGPPPVHPRCRCALAPAWITAPSDAEIADALAGEGDADSEG